MSRAGGFIPLLLLLAFFAASPAQAQDERITHFSSDITVARNGTLTVDETLSVVAAGQRIVHGIFRDFPTDYVDAAGRRTRVGFDVQTVMRDGQPEPYVVQNIANGKRVRIGRTSEEIPPGTHIYELVYNTTRQIGFFDRFDELYWNVTGTDWAFPIDAADATVHLPPGARITANDVYTGPQGARNKNARANELTPTSIRFATTQALAPHEGLTIVVDFEKGAVTPPPPSAQAAAFAGANAPAVVALGGLVLLLLYYPLVWWRVGRDPSGGVVVPLFAAPEGFSAAATRYVRRMGYDRKAFAAALIAMAVKRYLTISESDSGTYTLARTGKSENEAALGSGERAIGAALFTGPKDSIVLKNTNHARVSRAIGALSSALKREDEGVYFVTNRGWFIGGIVILALSAVGAALSSDDTAGAGFLLIWLSGWSVGTAFLMHRVVQGWQAVIDGPGSPIANTIQALFYSAFATPFVIALVVVLGIFGHMVAPLAAAALIAQSILAYVFYRLLKAPTVAGAKVRTEIEGFRMFLETAEKERLEVLHPPHVTPEVFEKFLPYAIALDCENAWSRTFEREARVAGIDTQHGGYVPLWYSGRSFSQLGTAGFASALGASVAGATAAAASAPGHVSGSGGAGFSGGGGGGGGGGGW